jgi:hypothetical protein
MVTHSNPQPASGPDVDGLLGNAGLPPADVAALAPFDLSARGFPTDLLETLTAARAACGEAATGLMDQRAELADREQRLSAAETELNRLVELEKDDLVARILDGEMSRPKRPRRLTRIENLKQEIEGLRLAMPVIRGRVRNAQDGVTAAQEAYTTAVLPLICAERSSALEEVRTKLSELAPLLARLMAPDLVQERLVGEHFTFLGSLPDVFSGTIVAHRFIQHLSDRLRPTELSPGLVTRAAQRAADSFTRAIQGE